MQVDGSLESLHCRQSRKETWLLPRQASATLVPSANRRIGRPGGSANIPTKIQAVPAAAPPLSLPAALGFICGDNPPPQLWASQLFSSPQQYPTYHLPKATSRNLLTTRYKPETIRLPINHLRISKITTENTQRRTQRVRYYRQNKAGNHWLNWRKSIGTRELDILETTTQQRMNLCR